MNIFLAGLTSLILAAVNPAAADDAPTVWRLDRNRSIVEFTVTKFPGIRVDGRFTDFEGEIRHDPRHPERSAVRWHVRVASVRTGEPNRDETLQGSDYFLASRHPVLRFESTRVRPLGDGSLVVDGRLTIRGITKEITTVAVPRAGVDTRAGFSAELSIDRFDFAIVGGRLMRAAIAPEVEIRVVAVPEP